MGLNTDAFTINASTDATTGGESVIKTGVTVDGDHASAGTAEVKPKFSINFSEYAASFVSKTTTAGTATVALTTANGDKIQKYDAAAGKWDNLSLTLDPAATAGDLVEVEASDLAGLFTTGDNVKIGADAYEVAVSGNEITFTWVGAANADGTTDTTAKVTEGTWTPTGAITIED